MCHPPSQGSILSPSLFLLVMDPLLRELQSLSVGTSVNDMYAGGFLHADDIRTLATTPSSLETQVSTVLKFTRENFLKLNTSKCEIIMFGRSATKSQKRDLEVNISVKDEVKCLGYRWKGNLSSLSMIQERIQKSRRAFFERQPESTFFFLYLPALCSANLALWSRKLDHFI